ncbi:sushi, von Willebrand factor type A, EGF and pentraxin domain-containing protein 1-like isoform X2 [Sycon ciliatum]|uniref:sushi, von Willebrand factor type A, EGF and pentraxin domain-containing protein 1-like isoform X2 n=1 Tax=Sycon ciliatum TaxID=27933 RepID=UPI0031F6472A
MGCLLIPGCSQLLRIFLFLGLISQGLSTLTRTTIPPTWASCQCRTANKDTFTHCGLDADPICSTRVIYTDGKGLWLTSFKAKEKLGYRLSYTGSPYNLGDGMERILTYQTYYLGSLAVYTKIESYCSMPNKISNGNITVFGKLKIDSVAQVTCQQGYLPSNHDPMKCVGDNVMHGKWNQQLQCDRVASYCPSKITNGVVDANTTHIGGDANVICNHGYRPSSSYPTKCTFSTDTHGVWSRALPTCDPQPNYCSSKITVSNGNVTVLGVSIGSVANVTCAEGYRAPNKVTCVGHTATNGKWDNAECTKIASYCSSEFANGAIDANITHIGGVVNFKCNYGYVSDDDDQGSGGTPLTCIASNTTHGVWENLPSCSAQPNYCSTAISVLNGRVMLVGGSIGSITIVTCNNGYQAPINNQATCVAHTATAGRWDNLECKPIEDYCPSTITVSNGNVSLFHGSTDRLAWVTCEYGYLPQKSTPMTCGVYNATHGQWEDLLECKSQPNYCSSTITVSNGNATVLGDSIGSVANLNCEQGYRAPNKVTCVGHTATNGKWDNAECTRIASYCSTTFANGAVDANHTHIGIEANYTCDNGYVQGFVDKALKCTGLNATHGVWENLPNCNVVSDYCSTTISVSNGKVTVLGGSVGSVATVTCKSGYQAPSNNQATCFGHNATDGRWDKLECKPIVDYCPGTITVSNGHVSVFYESIARLAWVTCEYGYHPQKDSPMTCAVRNATHGQWENLLECKPQPNYCPSTIQIYNGNVTKMGSSIVDVATITCKTGFLADPKDKVACLKHNRTHGKWESVQCSPILDYCPSTITVNHGKVTIYQATVYRYAWVTCNYGYLPQKHTPMTCSEHNATNGKWDNLVRCDAITDYCPSNYNTSNGNVIMLGNSINDVATVTCDLGYLPSNTNPVTCSAYSQTYGRWNNPPSCDLIASYCSNTLRNGEIHTTGTPIGAEANFTCNDGYSATSNSSIQCTRSTTAHGVWNRLPSCDLILNYCDKFVAPEPATVLGHNGTIGAKVVISCEDGYALSDASPVVCSSSGQWSHNPECLLVLEYCGTYQAPVNGRVNNPLISQLALTHVWPVRMVTLYLLNLQRFVLAVVFGVAIQRV